VSEKIAAPRHGGERCGCYDSGALGARRRDNKLESGKSGNVVFFARFDLVILAIRNSLGSCGS
jgi:hypothetical protein